MRMIWEGTPLSINVLTSKNAYQSKNQDMMSNELPEGLRCNIVLKTSGKD